MPAMQFAGSPFRGHGPHSSNNLYVIDLLVITFIVGGALAAKAFGVPTKNIAASRPLKNVGKAGKTIPMAAPQKNGRNVA
jgi:hypothetical protein